MNTATVGNASLSEATCRRCCRCRVDQFRSRVGADPAPGPPPFCRVDPFRRERIGLEVSVEASVEASAPAAFGGIILVPSPSRGPLSPAPGISGDPRAPASRRGPSLRGTGFRFRTLRPCTSGWIRPTDILYKGARPPPQPAGLPRWSSSPTPASPPKTSPRTRRCSPSGRRAARSSSRRSPSESSPNHPSQFPFLDRPHDLPGLPKSLSHSLAGFSPLPVGRCDGHSVHSSPEAGTTYLA